ncbi:hypothetical protein CJ179_34635 [Rhodococcus sp. ACS1]|uniref:hypothetical protein n=1 Tax=Rhodococcus TaxID=1827 RepID=UPI00093517BC|nr:MULTISPECIES: hypothetical protein [Rhodococcus]PBC39212.1 hypothetical protein CJ179_34635 [Rhodococcus sp. ACS1]
MAIGQAELKGVQDISALFARRGQGSRYRYDWALFADWCTALQASALPADPLALASFLDAHPAARATQRRRVTAINWVHTASGYPAPGSARMIRQALSARAGKHDELSRAAREVLPTVPTVGWPHGLFGRRDALLLVLNCIVGISATEVGHLQRSDITYDGNIVTVGAGHDVDLHPLADNPRCCPVAIYLRWARLQAFFDRYPSNRVLARSLASAHEISDDTVESYGKLPGLCEGQDGPLLPSFDQWGHFAALRRDRRGVSSKSVSAIATAYLTGTASSRHTRSDPPDTTSAAIELEGEVSPASGDSSENETDCVSLDPDQLTEQYEAAIARKYADVRALGDLTETFEDIDRKADAILSRTEELLAQMGLS